MGQARLMEAVGASDFDFLEPFIAQLANVGSLGSKLDEGGINFVLSVVRDVHPRDQVEAMLRPKWRLCTWLP